MGAVETDAGEDVALVAESVTGGEGAACGGGAVNSIFSGACPGIKEKSMSTNGYSMVFPPIDEELDKDSAVPEILIRWGCCIFSLVI